MCICTVVSCTSVLQYAHVSRHVHGVPGHTVVTSHASGSRRFRYEVRCQHLLGPSSVCDNSYHSSLRGMAHHATIWLEYAYFIALILLRFEIEIFVTLQRRSPLSLPTDTSCRRTIGVQPALTAHENARHQLLWSAFAHASDIFVYPCALK